MAGSWSGWAGADRETQLAWKVAVDQLDHSMAKLDQYEYEEWMPDSPDTGLGSLSPTSPPGQQKQGRDFSRGSSTQGQGYWRSNASLTSEEGQVFCQGSSVVDGTLEDLVVETVEEYIQDEGYDAGDMELATELMRFVMAGEWFLILSFILSLSCMWSVCATCIPTLCNKVSTIRVEKN